MPVIFALLWLGAAPALAQQTIPHDAKRPSPVATSATKPTNAIVADPSNEAKSAFLALSESDRKALQDGLGWLGFYNGAIDGAFGKRSIDALIAYQRSLGATDDGIVTTKGLTSLKDAAAKARAAVGFKLFDDPATGVRIGAPLKLIEKRESGAGFTRFASEDGAIGLDMKETSGSLATLYKTLTADAGGRKITYKVIKPDAFFVIAGEEGDKKFYRRYAASPVGSPDPQKLRGFVFVYPRDRAKALDPVALAVANAFDPFPSAPLPPTPIATPAPTPTPTPEGPKLTATALVVAPGLAVTTIDARRCKAPTIEGKPVRFLESEGGLTRLRGEFGAGAARPTLGESGDDLVALSLSAAGGTKTTLQIAATEFAPGSGGAKVIAALGPAASGAPLFDRQGRLVAFVAPIEAAKRRAGVVLAEPHATVPASGLAPGVAAAAGPLSAPAIARLMRSAVVGLFCAS